MVRAMDVERQVLAEYKAELEGEAKKLEERENRVINQEMVISQREALLHDKARIQISQNDVLWQFL